MPNRGHGEVQKIAKELQTHSTRISQVLRGSVDLTLEQASRMARYLGLNHLESDYFIGLVQKERAGTLDLKESVQRQLESLKERSLQLVHRVEKDRVLTEQEKATFYSSWYYTGIQMASSISGLNSIDAIAKYFDLPRDRVRLATEFLLATGLCAEKLGEIRMGTAKTHLESNSPFVARHHANWRIKAMQRHEKLTENELSYTAPVSISKKDQISIRESLASFIEKFVKAASQSSPEEQLCCLNVDWFEF